MTAFLPVDILRVHAAPDVLPAAIGPTGPQAGPHAAPRPRAVLTAHWTTAPDGRLTCCWQADASARFRPPPD